MSVPADFYAKGIKQKLKNYWAAWLPNTRFSVGDIGVLNGYVFEKVGSLSELKIKYYEQARSDLTSIEIVSDTGVALSFKAAGEKNENFSHVATEDAGMKVDFGAEGAFLVNAPKTFEEVIGDPLNLQNQIIGRFNKGAWQKDWVVIVRLVRAPIANIFISQSRFASLELSAKIDFSPPLGGLGNLGAGISVKFQKGDAVKIIDGQNINPLFQLGRLKSRLIREPRFFIRSMRSENFAIPEGNLTPGDSSSDLQNSLCFETLDDTEISEENSGHHHG